MIKLYSAEWCTSCTPVKKFIKENNLEVEIVDVDDQKYKDELTASGYRTIPLLKVNKQFVHHKDIILAYLKTLVDSGVTV